MKLSDFKDKIDAYFDAISSDELIQRFEKIGYEFEVILPEYEVYALSPMGKSKEDVSISDFLSDAEIAAFKNPSIKNTDEFICGLINSVSDEGEFLGNRYFAMAA